MTPSPGFLNPSFLAMATELLQETVLDNPYICKYGGLFPSPQQALFLTAPVEEIGYGGQAGGGKSAALLAAALQYVDIPGYAALLLRQSYSDLVLPKALIPLSHEWLTGTPAHWNGTEHQWRFPSGATLSFGYLQTENDKYRYQSSAFLFCGFDEVTQFTESQYTYLHSRLRRDSGVSVPIRMRWASNPGGMGHDWVKAMFPVTAKTPALNWDGRMFIPARLEDNPGLDRIAYAKQLDKLDPVTRAQLKHGDWAIRPEGNLFKRIWFSEKIIPAIPDEMGQVIRYWDLAATEKTEKKKGNYWDLAATEKKKGNDPDFVSGCKMAWLPDARLILDMIHFRGTPEAVESRVKETAQLDGHKVGIRIEQEPGASSKLLISNYQRHVLKGYSVKGIPSLTGKVERAKPMSAACQRGEVLLLNGPWIPIFLDELAAFPVVAHDDQVDAATGAYNELSVGFVRMPGDFGWT